MHQDVLHSKRRQLRSEANLHWTAFTSEDLHRLNGAREDLVTLLEHRYGFARPRAEREADRFFSEFETRLRNAC